MGSTAESVADVQILRVLAGGQAGEGPPAADPVLGAVPGDPSAPVTAPPSTFPAMAVLSAPASAVPLIRNSSLVEAVVQDIVVRASPMQCVGSVYLTNGVSTASLSSRFSWPGCFNSKARLVWRGSTCSDGTSIYWTQIRAYDKTTGYNLVDSLGRQCVMNPSLDRTFNLNYFGACGSAPLFARSLPTLICSPTGGGGSGGSTPPPAGTVLPKVTSGRPLLGDSISMLQTQCRCSTRHARACCAAHI